LKTFHPVPLRLPRKKKGRKRKYIDKLGKGAEGRTSRWKRKPEEERVKIER